MVKQTIGFNWGPSGGWPARPPGRRRGSAWAVTAGQGQARGLLLRLVGVPCLQRPARLLSPATRPLSPTTLPYCPQAPVALPGRACGWPTCCACAACTAWSRAPRTCASAAPRVRAPAPPACLAWCWPGGVRQAPCKPERLPRSCTRAAPKRDPPTRSPTLLCPCVPARTSIAAGELPKGDDGSYGTSVTWWKALDPASGAGGGPRTARPKRAGPGVPCRPRPRGASERARRLLTALLAHNKQPRTHLLRPPPTAATTLQT